MDNILMIVQGQLSLMRKYMEAATESYVENPGESNMYRIFAEQTWDSTKILIETMKKTWPDEFKEISPQLQDIILNLDLEFG